MNWHVLPCDESKLSRPYSSETILTVALKQKTKPSSPSVGKTGPSKAANNKTKASRADGRDTRCKRNKPAAGETRPTVAVNC